MFRFGAHHRVVSNWRPEAAIGLADDAGILSPQPTDGQRAFRGPSMNGVEGA